MKEHKYSGWRNKKGIGKHQIEKGIEAIDGFTFSIGIEPSEIITEGMLVEKKLGIKGVKYNIFKENIDDVIDYGYSLKKIGFPHFKSFVAFDNTLKPPYRVVLVFNNGINGVHLTEKEIFNQMAILGKKKTIDKILWYILEMENPIIKGLF